MRRAVFVLLVGGLGLAALLALGAWQVQRLGWKQGVLSTIENRITATPVALPAHPDFASDAYLSVELTGRFDERELHVYTVKEGAGPGYRVIRPFVTTAGRRVLVDAGYVPAASKTDPRPALQGRLVGNLIWPDEKDGFTPPPDTQGNLWYARDPSAMAVALETEPVMIVARAGTALADSITVMPVTTRHIPNNHLQYAITWFLLALVWAAMTLLFLKRSRTVPRADHKS